MQFTELASAPKEAPCTVFLNTSNALAEAPATAMTRQAAWRLNQDTEGKALPAMTQGSERGGGGSVHGLWGSTVQIGFSDCGQSHRQEK